MYGTNEILDVQVAGESVFLFVDGSDPELAIWKHAILDANGTLGPKELVLDWSTTGDYAESEFKDMVISKDNIMYIGTDNPQPTRVVIRIFFIKIYFLQLPKNWYGVQVILFICCKVAMILISYVSIWVRLVTVK